MTKNFDTETGSVTKQAILFKIFSVFGFISICFVDNNYSFFLIPTAKLGEKKLYKQNIK